MSKRKDRAVLFMHSLSPEALRRTRRDKLSDEERQKAREHLEAQSQLGDR